MFHEILNLTPLIAIKGSFKEKGKLEGLENELSSSFVTGVYICVFFSVEFEFSISFSI